MKLFLLILALILAPPAWAAPLSSGYVVTTCGTLPTPPGPYLAGRSGEPTIDLAGDMCINGTITASNPSTGATGSAVPSSATYVAGNKSGNLVGVTLDGSSNLNVNCAAGCSAGATSNATSGVATSSTNGATVAWLYGFNGATWDQLQVDTSKFLKVTAPNLEQAQGATSAGEVGPLIQCAVLTSAPTYITATTNPVSCTTGGRLREDLSSINGANALTGNGVTGTGSLRVTVASDNTAFSVNGTLQTQTDTVMVGGVNVKEINAVTPLMGNGVTGTGSQRVTIASDNTPFKVGIDQTTDITTNGVEIAPTAGAAAGITISASSAVESGHILKASAGNLYELSGETGASAGNVMVFNSTTVPADGAVTPVECFSVPANQPFSKSYSPGPVAAFATGISVAFSTPAGSAACLTKTASVTAYFSWQVK